MGGVESHCEEIYPRILRLNADLDITVIGRRAYAGVDSYSFQGIKVVPLWTLTSMHFEAITSTLLSILYARLKGATVLHIHAIGPAVAAPIARLLGMRVLMTHHGEDFNREKWGRLAKMVLRLGERTAVVWAHHVIAVSPTIEARLKGMFPHLAEKISFVPNGAPIFDLSEQDSLETVRNLSLEPGKYILGVGRLVPEKGFDCLIAAFKKSGIKDCKLVIAGSSDHDTAYARELLGKASDRIVFLGKRQRPILAALYRHCRCFVLPSSHEALAIVALEAASCGAPILMSDISANRNFGLPETSYFKLNDANALAKLLQTAPAASHEHNKRIIGLFSWDQSAIQTEKILSALLENRRLPAPATVDAQGSSRQTP